MNYLYFYTLLVISVKIGHCKICQGTSNGISPSTRDDPDVYVRQFGNCTIINSNLEIVHFLGTFPDLTFLDSIEEVKGYILISNTDIINFSLNNLRLVRGQSLFHESSIFIVGNDRLKRTIFPNLREITKGQVTISANPALCFVKTINWTEVTYEPYTSTPNITMNSVNCESCGNDCDANSCWSEEHCQKFRKLNCMFHCPTGCLEDNHYQCCAAECASGCMHSKDDCVKCRNYNNSGECVEACPEQEIYDSLSAKKLPNPQGRYAYEKECVEKCPSWTVHSKSESRCVSDCPDNHYESEGTCRKCNASSICPKGCSLKTHLNSVNVKEIVNCSVIKGNFQILKSFQSSDLLPYLEQFSTITEITGFLMIQDLGEGIDDLSFLRNLKVIRGRTPLSNLSALHVQSTRLKSLGLESLETIENNGITIIANKYLEYLDLPSLKNVNVDDGSAINVKENEKLCYVNKETFTGLSDKSQHVSVATNKDVGLCEQENKTCHKECIGGCWGPGNRQCRSCKKFNFEGECLSSCDMHLNLYVDEGVCKRCHPQCVGGCYGEGALNCTSCRNAKDDSTCMERCPELKYLDNKTRRCLKCDTLCKDGCTGPDRRLGKGGCSDCHILSLKTNECLAKEHICELGSFMDFKDTKVYDASGAKFERLMRTCNECNHMCINCSDKGTTLNVCHCRYVEYDGNCHKGCPSQQFNDSKKCKACDSECDECYGPGPENCRRCKNIWVNIYQNANITQTKRKQHNESDLNIWKNDSETATTTPSSNTEKSEYMRFVCISTCPEDKKYAVEISITLDEDSVLKQRVCQATPDIDQLGSRQNSASTLIGTLVFGGICLVFVFVVVLGMLRAKKAKAEENKAKLQARIEGLNTEEILFPSNHKPDLSSLRLIKESELEKGLEIGSGAFGTVYRGIWRPGGEKVRVAVAIKILTKGCPTDQHQEILEEARVMASVSHPCCIRILAICLTRQIMLITPLVAHGCLLSYIRRNGQTLSSHILLKWAAQIAKGMGYLEQKDIVHRDLAARNILVQGLNQVKITDFGLAKLITSDEQQCHAMREMLPLKWLAFESLQYRIFTPKSDVWSYGVTLWELFTYGQRPFENINASNMARHLEMGERLPQPSICTIDVYMIMIKCWMIDADSRPSFHELEEKFAEMSRDPGRYLVISENELMRMPSEMHKDNRSKVIMEMNLDDEEDLICGEDYLCPATPTLPPYMQEESSFSNLEYMNNSDCSGVTQQRLLNLERALQTKRKQSSDHYMAEPGIAELPRPPSLDEMEILKMENLFGKKNKKEDYMEPVALKGFSRY